jgi:hypothetical protein
VKHERNFKISSSAQLDLVLPVLTVKPKMQRGLTPDQFFDSRMIRGGDDECWPWIGGKSSGSLGYGIMKDAQKKVIYAHRFAWERENGPIPEGLCALHDCDNPACCNPNHLSLGTNGKNTADKIARGRMRQKMKTADVLAILRHFICGWTIERLAAFYRVTLAAIRHVLSGKTWSKLTGIVFEKGTRGKYELIREQLRQRFEPQGMAA